MKPIQEHVSQVMGQLSQTIQKDSEGKLFSKECQRCSQRFDVEDTYANRNYPRTCPACIADDERENAERISKARKEGWESLCPAIFKETRFEMLPNQVASKRVSEWSYGAGGLILHGETRKGKTRSAWLLLKKLHFEGRRIKVLNSSAGLTYASLYNKSASDVEKWVNGLIEADVLFLDDVFKVKLTDSFEQVVFSIIDRRCEAARPIIVTTNDTSDSLASRLSEDRSAPLLARLKEFCKAIQF